MRRMAAIVGLLVPAFGFSQPPEGWLVHGGPAISLKILGSVDQRSGAVLGFQKVRPEKRIAILQIPAQMVFEGYFQVTSGGAFEYPRDTTGALGGFAAGRWETSPPAGPSFFIEVGLGLQLSTQATHDLNIPINFTPVGGLGIAWTKGKSRLQVTARYMHVSNAGIRPPNRGQNYAQLLVGWRF
jgi:hypothetical protein